MQVNKLQVSLIPHTLYFKQPAGTSRGVYHTRKVWYVLVKSEEFPGRWGIGECAPLPDLSCDALPDYEYILAKACRKLEQEGTLKVDELRLYPSILFGFETALLHFNKGDFKLFDTPFSRGEAGIPTNGLIWMGDYDSMFRQIEEKINSGFRCVKIKIGAIRFEEELSLLKYIRKHFTKDQIELRVDANGAFSVGEAPDKLKRLAELDIHSIEQPIRSGQWEEMSNLVSQTPLPIGLDEELIGINTLEEKNRLLDSIHPQYIILKPSLHGGMSGCEEWIREAEERNIGWWITSALESNIGLNAIAQWCALFGNPLPQGLGTGKLFVENINLPLSLKKDCLWYNPENYRSENLPNFVRNQATITIEGKIYTPDTLAELKDKYTSPIFKDLYSFLLEWFSDSPFLSMQTSGSTGTPKQISVRKNQMLQSAYFTCERLELKKGDTALLCMPLQYIAGKMMVVRAIAAGLNLIVREPSGNPLAEIQETPRFAAMTPMQVYNTLKTETQTQQLKNIEILIIGGGSIDKSLEAQLKTFPNQIYSTYGMTETLSHIALRRLTSTESSEYYIPFPSVKLSLSVDSTLIIDAPLIADEILHTNDIVDIQPNGHFRVLGRKDNVINSGGIKLQIEAIEEKIAKVLSCNFAVTSVPDEKLGEALVLLVEKAPFSGDLTFLSKYEQPKHIFVVDSLPITGNGKIDRKACKLIASSFLDRN